MLLWRTRGPWTCQPSYNPLNKTSLEAMGLNTFQLVVLVFFGLQCCLLSSNTPVAHGLGFFYKVDYLLNIHIRFLVVSI